MRTPVAIESDTAWQSLGLCFQSPKAHELMFHATTIGKGALHSKEVMRAKAICQVCGVTEECLAFALQTRQVFGIWGGSTPQERGRMRRR